MIRFEHAMKNIIKLEVGFSLFCLVIAAPIASAQHEESSVAPIQPPAETQEQLTTGSLPDPLPTFVSPAALTRPWAAERLPEAALQSEQFTSDSALEVTSDTEKTVSPKRSVRTKIRRKASAASHKDERSYQDYKWNMKIFGASE